LYVKLAVRASGQALVNNSPVAFNKVELVAPRIESAHTNHAYIEEYIQYEFI